MLLEVLLVPLALASVLAAESTCFSEASSSHVIERIEGDAILTVFVDDHYGPFCNISTSKGQRQRSLARRIVQNLNDQEYVSGYSLGLRFLDTCRDEMTVYKGTLEAAIESDCSGKYDLGVLAPEGYAAVLEPLDDYTVLPISVYNERNLTKPLIHLIVHYLTTRYELIDLLMAESDDAIDLFMEISREAGLCVMAFGDINKLSEINSEMTIVLIGNRTEIADWIKLGEKIAAPRKTWLALATDDTRIDDLIPVGSFVVHEEHANWSEPSATSDNDTLSVPNPAFRSPHVLGIGRAVIEIAHSMRLLRKQICVHEKTCVLPRFNPSRKHDLQNAELYDVLRLQPKMYFYRYLVSMKMQNSVTEVASYNIEVAKLRVVPEQKAQKMPKLCLRKLVRNCRKCVNFNDKHILQSMIAGKFHKGIFKLDIWIPVFVTVEVCGTVASLLIFIFIVYRFFVEDVLDGNPTFTLLIIVVNVFILQTVLPFSMEDDYFGAENLNSRKILVSTLSFGLLFSIMLTRSLFLVFSKADIFTNHINGYLQGIMLFFMAGIQVAISTIYFVLGTEESANVVRSLKFIALLSYDIFLLLALFVTCCFVAPIRRNYREGKCFFATVIGLTIAWAVWITCFALVRPYSRDLVVCFGILATGYLVIIGILIPRIYYMTTHIARPATIGPSGFVESSLNTITTQCRSIYDSVQSVKNGSGQNVLQVPSNNPGYYGTSSSDRKQCHYPEYPRSPRHDDYVYRGETREVDSLYATPRVFVENTDYRSSEVGGFGCTNREPRRRDLSDRNVVETDIYVEGRRSLARRSRDESYPSRAPSPRLEQTEATIREEDEDVGNVRITRL